eukprot:7114740-Alexandrium_andersonii.AAC.1
MTGRAVVQPRRAVDISDARPWPCLGGGDGVHATGCGCVHSEAGRLSGSIGVLGWVRCVGSPTAVQAGRAADW